MTLTLRMVRIGSFALSLVAVLAARPGFAQPAYYDVGVGHTVYSLSADGSVAAGDRADGFFYWTPSGGVTFIGGNSAASGTGAGGRGTISDDGTLLGGNYTNPATMLSEMSRYDIANATWTNLGSLGSSSGIEASSAWGISGDGNSVVGLGWVNAGSAHAIQWKQGGMTEDLGSTVAGSSSRANGTDYDGDVVVGWQDASDGYRQGAIWTNGTQLVLTNGGDPMSEAQDVTADGTWVVGDSSFATADEAWRYNRTTGVVETLGVLDPNLFFPSRAATGISDDGRTIVGFERDFFGFPPVQTGTIWREGIGIQDLTAFALSQGVPLPAGTQLSLPLAISADGLAIAGIDSNFQGFVIVVPEPTGAVVAVMGLMSILIHRARRNRWETLTQQA